jgi:diguanylate cyclase (GGDEF)-like protein
LALVVILAAAMGAGAAIPVDQLRAMEHRAASDPKKAIADARAEAQTSRDREARLAALRLMAMSYDNLDDNPGLRDSSTKGLALARDLGDRSAEVELMTLQATSLFNEGKMPQASRLHDAAIRLAQEQNLDRELAKAWLAKAHMLVNRERQSEAMELLLKAHALLEKLGERLLLSSSLSAVGNILTVETAPREQLERAVAYHKRAMALVDPSDRYELSTIYYNLGVTYSYLKEYGEAFKALEKCLAIGREINDPHTIAFVNYRMGSIELARGHADKALPHFDRALPGFRQAENVQLEFLTQVGRARASAAAGRRADSLSALAAAKDLIGKLDSPGREVQYHDAAAEVQARSGNWEQAYQAMRSLREADKRAADASNRKLTQELQARFGARQRESENELLRLDSKVQEARWLLLLLGLGLAAVVVLALVLYVFRQARQNRRFAALAMRDDLTGIANRRSILEYARATFRGRRSGDTGFVLALVDIDHFKSINDQLGHSVGDEVLKAFAGAGQKALRGDDRMGRFGGEEFVIVMPNLAIETVPSVFERLRNAVQRIEARGWPEGRTLTFSMGATAARDTDPDLDSIIKRADDALYRAKNNGRNRLEVG